MQELGAKYALPVPLQPRNQSLCSPFHAPLPQVILYSETLPRSSFGKVATRSTSAGYQCAKFLDLIGVKLVLALLALT